MFPPQLPSFHFSHDIFSTLSLTPLTSFFWVTAVVNDPEEVAHTERSASEGAFQSLPVVMLPRMGLSLSSIPDVLDDIKLLSLSSPGLPWLKNRELYHTFYIVGFSKSCSSE